MRFLKRTAGWLGDSLSALGALIAINPAHTLYRAPWALSGALVASCVQVDAFQEEVVDAYDEAGAVGEGRPKTETGGELISS